LPIGTASHRLATVAAATDPTLTSSGIFTSTVPPSANHVQKHEKMA